MTPTSAGADHRVKSISVALGHAESLDAADEGNHSQAIERSVKHRWYEFTLSRSEGRLALRDLWDCFRSSDCDTTYHRGAEQFAEIREAGQKARQPTLHGLQQDDGRGRRHLF